MSFQIEVADLPALALGSSVLACGGGGNPYYGQLVARDVLAKSGPVSVIGLEEMDPDAVAVMSVQMGAPLVGIEKPVSLRALRMGFRAVERAPGVRVGALVAAEVGGSQSVLPVLMAAESGLPLLDGDGMGRAFPEAQMCTFLIYGIAPGVPASFCDDHELLLDFPRLPFVRSGLRFGGTSRGGRLFGVALERIFRRYTARKGGVLYINASIDRASLERTLVRGTIRLALDVGRAVAAARAAARDPVGAILEVAGGRRVFEGKIGDVQRRFRRAHDWGSLKIDGLGPDAGRRGEIEFKNEYLVLSVDDRVVLTVPDLVSVVETESGKPVTTEVLRPGLRVSVLGFRSTPLYRTPQALEIVGPRAFGYDLDFVPIDARHGAPAPELR